MVARNSRKMALRPGNRLVAKVYAASALKNSCSTVTEVATKALLTNQRQAPSLNCASSPGRRTPGSASPAAGSSPSQVGPPVEAELDHGEHQQQHEQRVRERAGVAHLVELERRLVDVVDHRRRPVHRSAAGHDVDLGEHLE